MVRVLTETGRLGAPIEVAGPLDHYSLLASAVAGRPLEVHATERERSYTDGIAVFVPESMDEQALIVAVVVQSALLGAGSLDFSVVGHLSARGALARRYLMLEAQRAVEARGAVVPAWVHEAVVSRPAGEMSASAEESLERARSREEIPPAPDVFGSIRPRALKTGARVSGAPGKLDRQGKTEFLDTPKMDDEEEDSDSINFMKVMATPSNVFGDNPLMKWMKSTLGVGTRESPDGGGSGAEMPAGGARWGDEPGDAAAAVRAVAGVNQRPPEGPVGRLRYPEWNEGAHRYREAYCHVRNQEPPSGDELIRPHRDPALRREIARLGLDYERHRHEVDGHDLDLTAVVDFSVARLRGETADTRVYQARRKTARDLAVLVLLDASGSTADHRAGRGSVFDDERRVVADLVDVLEEFGDRVGAFAFNSRGPELVRFLRIKEFDGRFDDSALARLAGVKPSGYTRLGAAIRHSTHLLTSEGGTSNRLLVVVSDGLPYDDGYEDRYAETDTRRALGEAVSDGVGCLCVSLGAIKGDDALAEVWGTASHIRLLDPADLGRSIGPLFRTALEVAARRGGDADGSGSETDRRLAAEVAEAALQASPK